MADMTSSILPGDILELQALSSNTTVDATGDTLSMTDTIALRDRGRMAASTRGDLYLHLSTITGSPAVDAVVQAMLHGKWTEIGRSSDVPGAVGYWRIPLTFETLSQCPQLRVTWENATSLDGSNNFVVTAASSHYHFAP